MRRLVLLTAIAVVAIGAVAYAAVNNTATYTAKVTYKGKPSTTKPVPTAYQGILHVDTDPAGNQPETAPVTDVYYAKGFKTNSKYFPFCNQTEVDGQQSIPAKCKKAIVGTGTASSLAGTPGNPSSQSVRENLTVTAMNGAKGSYLFLVLNSTPDAPVAINNRVVPGQMIKSSGAFAFLLRFKVPADLQEQLGLKIALTDFNVKVPATLKTVTVKGKKVKLPYLALTSCKGSLPQKTIVDFNHTDDNGQTTTQPVTSTSTVKC